jgi:hypothetical protein
MSRRTLFGLAILLAVLLATKLWTMDWDAAPPSYVAAAPTTRPERDRVQLRQRVLSTQPLTVDGTALEFNAVDLEVPPEIVAKIEKRIGRNPFAEFRVQIQNLNGMTKFRVADRTASRGDAPAGSSKYGLLMRELTQERRKGKRAFAGWVVLTSDDATKDVATFVRATWPDPTPATSPAGPAAAMTAPIAVDLLWVYSSTHWSRVAPTTRTAAATRPQAELE